MGAPDLELAIDWAASEGWNPGLGDLNAFLAADPEGFLAGVLNGEPVTSISAVRYGESYGFIGFYICRKSLRGKGYGLATWTRAIQHLEGRTIGLDGVIDQQDNYRKSGFQLAHRNIRMGGLATADTPMDPRLSPLGLGIFASVRDYDRSFFPDDRTEFLKVWCAPNAATRRGFVFMEDGKLMGYGVIRQCQEGFKIGPLFADTPEVADSLFRALAGQVKGQTVYLDIPEPNQHAQDLAQRYDLSAEFETARMYKGPAPSLPLDRTYGITTFELG
ncbi:GNAT family N-acetyltransferase [Roseibium litorale]|uniref:GNAT family N-acetyltransferase n=1 Tax=Roseibium litorale TaxID=2803841 RepID=A0ABR9CGD8_9HYPH|nr:GNAT family N-acetyltransferase [Roseibium litorale]MBD8889967.1 GNAT family N-acetyltransferase [Roseibium litorale]